MKTLAGWLLVAGALAAMGGANMDEGRKPEAAPAPAATIDELEMRTYYVNFLRRPEQPPASTLEVVQKLQRQHLDYMDGLAKEGKIVLAGPFLDDTGLRGMVVYKVDTLEEATVLAKGDPAVQAGRLEIEIHPWMSPVGVGWNCK